MKHNVSANGITRGLVSTLSGKMIRVLIAVPLLLCALVGFVVVGPLWLASRFWEMLGFDRSY